MSCAGLTMRWSLNVRLWDRFHSRRANLTSRARRFLGYDRGGNSDYGVGSLSRCEILVYRRTLLVHAVSFHSFSFSSLADGPRELVSLQRVLIRTLGLSGDESVELSLERVVVGERVNLDWKQTKRKEFTSVRSCDGQSDDEEDKTITITFGGEVGLANKEPRGGSVHVDEFERRPVANDLEFCVVRRPVQRDRVRQAPDGPTLVLPHRRGVPWDPGLGRDRARLVEPDVRERPRRVRVLDGVGPY